MKNHKQAKTVVLGLGSNLGDRLSYLSAAIDMLTQGKSKIFQGKVKLSPIYESPALLLPESPESWNIPFYNMVIVGKTNASPLLLLHTIKKIELLLGRQNRGRWAPREIDVDVLAIEDSRLTLDALVVPHPGLLERDFVYLPFADILPEWSHPIEGKVLKDMLPQLPKGNAVRTDLSCDNSKILAA